MIVDLNVLPDYLFRVGHGLELDQLWSEGLSWRQKMTFFFRRLIIGWLLTNKFSSWLASTVNGIIEAAIIHPGRLERWHMLLDWTL